MQSAVHAVLQGLGVVRAALSCAGRLPDNVYISHNHTDHAGVLQCHVPAASQPATRCIHLTAT
jgi:metal-dependent hydrolase (beta-lactamase superfamily II)